jgi:outer membrane receptor protein involved in Fe transport
VSLKEVRLLTLGESVAMKTSLFREHRRIFQSANIAWAVYVAKCIHHRVPQLRVATLCCATLCCATLGLPGYAKAQTAVQTQTRPQSQGQQLASDPKADDPADIPTLKTSITVTDSISADSPANITALSSDDISTNPGVSLDEVLRIVPGFSMLRRTSGVVASATIQGVSLRGLGLSGASRTLVLWDGVPLNDPYGGWVNWVRVSPESVSEVEVTRGGTTSVFGDLGMGGTISIFSRTEEKNLVDVTQEGGSQGTVQTHGSYSWTGGHFGASADVRAFTTDGYFVVPGSLRGAIDQPAYNRFIAGSPRVSWGDNINRVSMKVDVLAQRRNLGTLITGESTSLGELSGHYSREMKSDNFSFIGYYEHEGFDAKYSAISPNRNVETLVDSQHVPSQGTGAAAYWQHDQTRWHVTGGADVEYVNGFSHDLSPFSGMRVSGGDLLQHGVFGQADVRVGPVQFFGGMRYQFTGTQHNIPAPNAGIAYGKGLLRIRGSVNRSFRVPTLNELYRPFRMGNITTLSNPLLVPETMFGMEVGVDLRGKTRRLGVTAFRNSLGNFIQNVTLQTTPNLIIRQRQNAGNAINKGFETDMEQRWGSWLGSIGYLYADSRLTSGALSGLRIPGVPRHQGTAQITYLHRGTMASAAFRAYSSQFDDQANQFKLPGFALLQFACSQRIWRQLSATLDLENALDRYYVVAYTPIVNNGEPIGWRVGLRWNGKLR